VATVYLADLCRERGGKIEDETFEGSLILGPAIAYILGCEFIDPLFVLPSGSSMDSMLYELPADRRKLIGLVPLVRCVFRDCHFEDVGFASHDPVVMAKLRNLPTSLD
jgi:hypothetical protein